MPKRKPDGTVPNWDALYEQAAPQGGYFTIAQAGVAGYSPVLLQYHIGQGRLQRVGRGVFRLVHFPPSDREDLVVIWLWSDKRGTFSHDTALTLHGLSDALPAVRHLTVPASWRRRRLKVPRGVFFHYADIPSNQMEWNAAIPVTSPFRTIADCIDFHVEPDLVNQAIAQAARRGLLSQEEAVRLAKSAAGSTTGPRKIG
jgi:predicted transcriptional regulator of viral defense system